MPGELTRKDRGDPVVYSTKIEKLGVEDEIWDEIVVKGRTYRETSEKINRKLRQNGIKEKISLMNISYYLKKLKSKIREHDRRDIRTRLNSVVNIVGELENILTDIKDSMEEIQGKKALAPNDQQYLIFHEAFHRDVRSFVDTSKLLAGIQGKLQTNITIDVVDIEFRKILQILTETDKIPNHVKKELLMEIRDKIKESRQKMISGEIIDAEFTTA